MDKREAGRLICDLLSGRELPEARLDMLSPADGEDLADWALRFKVGGLLYREIKFRNIRPELIPVDARNRLRDAYRDLATKNTSLFFDAVRVLRSLADEHMPVVALKGLSLAKDIYGDIALRSMSDLDFLVKEEDLVRAGRILLTLGYRQGFPAWERLGRAYHHLPAFTNDRETLIELHWNIVTPDSPIKVDLDGLWERARLIRVDDIEVRAFSPEDLFLHVCIHACSQMQTGLDLVPLCDIAGMIRSPADKINWQTVAERATRWGGRKCVYMMLLLVRELLGASPPEHIMSEIKPADYLPVYFDEALEQIFDVHPEIVSHVVYGPEISRPGQLITITVGQLAKIRKIKGIKGKGLALMKKAFPSRENMAGKYPVSVSSPKIYLCYVFRLSRLIVCYTQVLFRHLSGDQSVQKAVRQAHRASAVSNWMFS